MQGYVTNNIDYSEKKGDSRLRGNDKKARDCFARNDVKKEMPERVRHDNYTGLSKKGGAVPKRSAA